jgi:hypothetical protein
MTFKFYKNGKLRGLFLFSAPNFKNLQSWTFFMFESRKLKTKFNFKVLLYNIFFT